jgi:UDP-N-acetylmuramate--alanine ligase
MKNHQKIHFIGVGGIGISSLAYLALEEGKQVTGSDCVGSALIEDLRKCGAQIEIGHSAENLVDDAELVIYTEAIDIETNPEYVKARQMKVPVLNYYEALGQLSSTKKTIAVVGTHGKTTTTAMLGLALINAGEDPTVIVGSKLKEFEGRNISIGGGDLLVVEGCEYRRSFLSLDPFGVVFLNCEAEHLDYYKDEEDYKNAYIELIRKIPVDGFLVANWDDENVREVAAHCAVEPVKVRVSDPEIEGLKPQVLGDFNKFNALFALKAAARLEADQEVIKKSLNRFRGTWRRLEMKGEFNGATVIDDYGHHPTEVFLTLEAIRGAYPDKRIVCIFQSHQHSRTRLLIDEFKGAFKYADKVVITDLYDCRDTDLDRAEIDGEKFAKVLEGTHPDVSWSGSLDATYDLLKKEIRPTDLLVVMGAGDVCDLAEKLVKN